VFRITIAKRENGGVWPGQSMILYAIHGNRYGHQEDVKIGGINIKIL
jgi:hypothetical protein